MSRSPGQERTITSAEDLFKNGTEWHGATLDHLKKIAVCLEAICKGSADVSLIVDATVSVRQLTENMSNFSPCLHCALHELTATWLALHRETVKTDAASMGWNPDTEGHWTPDQLIFSVVCASLGKLAGEIALAADNQSKKQNGRLIADMLNITLSGFRDGTDGRMQIGTPVFNEESEEPNGPPPTLN
jgi:hypothetical protein